MTTPHFKPPHSPDVHTAATNADTNTTLLVYNAAGEQIATAIDMNRDGLIGAADRISSNATSIVSAHGTTVLRRQSWQFSETGPVLLSTSDSTGDGRQSWQISFGLTNSTLSAINPASRTRTVTSTAPDGSTTVSEYQDGRLQTTTRTAGGTQLSTLTHGYDAHGRVVTNNDTRTLTLTAYNDADQVISVTVSGTGVTAQTTQFQYDTMGRRTVTTLPDGAHTYVSYLPTGEVSTNWGDRTYPVAYTYDYAGRMQTMTTWTNFAGNAGAAVTTWNYDANSGQLASKRYHDNLGPDYTYTPAGRLQTRLWARTNESGRVSATYTYNNAGDLQTVDYSDTTPDVTYTYDLRGRRLSASSAQSAVTYSYSDAGLLVAETWTAGPLAGLTATNSYDSLLRRSAVAVQSQVSGLMSQVSFGYDAASRLSEVAQASLPVSLSATYAYVPNAPGLVNSILFRNGTATAMTTTESYDNLNRLTEIGSVTPDLSTVNRHLYTYSAANQRTQRTDADGSYWNYGYDSLGQVTNATRRWADGTLVAGQQYGYLFDDIGNRQRSEVSGQRSDYSANLLNQYESRTVPGFVNVLGLATNSATVTVNNQPVTRQGDYFHASLAVSNSLTAVYTNLVTMGVLKNAGANGADIVATRTGAVFVARSPETFAHDVDGNLTGDGRWVYRWDGENRLIEMETDTNQTSAAGVPHQKLLFGYDHQSRRISKVVSNWTGATWTCATDLRFAYDGWNLLAEVGATGSVVRSYAWGLDLSGTEQGAGGIGGMLWMTSHLPLATSHFASFDGNGNVAALLNAATGQVSAEYEYSPFGETIRATGPVAAENVFRFSTKYTDAETGLLYYGYRYYQPSTGRWVNRDPKEEEGGWNLYVACVNDLQSVTDAHGLTCVRFVSQSASGRYRIVSSVDEIYIIEKVNFGLIGLFADGTWADDPVTVRRNKSDGCLHILIPLRIYIRAGLKLAHRAGEYSGYAAHAQDLSMGAGPNPVKGEVVDHERGHALAYWDKMRPMVIQKLERYCCDTRSTFAVEAEIRQVYNALQKNVDYLSATAVAANQATVSWYSNDPSYQRILPPIITIGETRFHFDYLWKMR